MTDKELEEPTMSLEELGNIKTVKVYTQAYVDKQQKRIAELKAQIEKMSERIEMLEGYERIVKKLQDNGFDTFMSIKEFCKEKIQLEKENAELKGQIEKMKCCGNCGKWENCDKDEMFSQNICDNWGE